MEYKYKMNYYEILEIPQDSSEAEIKKAYRKLAMKYHPDKNPDTGDKFKKISEAYSILSDKGKRKEYDTYGTTNDNLGKSIDPMDIFNNIFGNISPENFMATPRPGGVGGLFMNHTFNISEGMRMNISMNNSPFIQSTTTVIKDGRKVIRTETTRNGITKVSEIINSEPAKDFIVD
tara:strand:+ start:3612 stop:4139 length:528 start_codon:yes stop_codon:yes gene_type:complete